MPDAVTVIDLFCGAGGFSLGAHKAGFKIAASVDIDPVLTSCYKLNFPSANLFLEDIAQLDASDLLARAGLKTGTVAGIIGGPPCQGFSLMGKRAADDPRNALVEHFFRLIRSIRPAFFLMENVPGLIVPTSKVVLNQSIAKTEGYTIVGPLVIDAYDLGAATRRKRVIVLGYDPERCNPISEQDLNDLEVAIKYNVGDAIRDIPGPTGLTARRYRKVSKVGLYATKARTAPPEGLGSPEAKTFLSSGLVTGVQETTHTADVVERFSLVEQGSSDSVSRCRRLGWDHPAPTLRAGTGPDKGGFQAIRPLHPVENRVITVREGARLQGFPDWFTFHATKWHSFRMIGNSVSPIVAERLLSFVKSKLTV